MNASDFNQLARSKQGQGWLGVMEIVDNLDANSTICAEELKLQMERKIGRLILSGTTGCDESAMTDVCNQCIEALIEGELNMTNVC